MHQQASAQNAPALAITGGSSHSKTPCWKLTVILKDESVPRHISALNSAFTEPWLTESATHSALHAKNNGKHPNTLQGVWAKDSETKAGWPPGQGVKGLCRMSSGFFFFPHKGHHRKFCVS